MIFRKPHIPYVGLIVLNGTYLFLCTDQKYRTRDTGALKSFRFLQYNHLYTAGAVFGVNILKNHIQILTPKIITLIYIRFFLSFSMAGVMFIILQSRFCIQTVPCQAVLQRQTMFFRFTHFGGQLKCADVHQKTDGNRKALFRMIFIRLKLLIQTVQYHQ